MTEIGLLLPPLSALNRGSTVVHAAKMRTVTIPRGGWFRYPELVSLCGVGGWAEGGSEVTCKRCLRCLAGPGGADPKETDQ